MTIPAPSTSPKPRARIAVTTHWTELKLAAQAGTARPDARAAFDAFCRRYWSAVHSVIRAKHPHQPELAEDLTQEFFELRLVKSDDLDRLDPERGHFRSWLYTTLKHFLHDARRSRHAMRRDERLNDAFDEHDAAASTVTVSEYERHYAHAIADRAFSTLHARYAPKFARRGATVDERTLLTWLIDRDSDTLMTVLGITYVHARKTLSLLHQELWQRLEAEVAETVADEASLPSELNEVCRILRLRPPAEEGT